MIRQTTGTAAPAALHVELTEEERLYLDFLVEDLQAPSPLAAVRGAIADWIECEGPCLDPARNRFEAWKVARRLRSRAPACTEGAPCAGCEAEREAVQRLIERRRAAGVR